MSAELTKRESDVIRLSIFTSTDEVCAALGMKPQSVYNARHRAYRKLGVSGQQALLNAAKALGMIR